jgi:hypothetical protein
MNADAQGDQARCNPLGLQVDEPSRSAFRPRASRISTRAEAAWFVGRCLSDDNTPASRIELQNILESWDIDWLLVVGLSSGLLLLPALHMSLQQKALIRLLPSDLKDHLKMISDINRERNRLIARQAAEFFAALNKRGLRPVLIKGVLSLFEVGFDPGIPMMADVDILMAGEEFPSACRALRSLGYVTLGDPSPHDHAMTFHRAGELVTIDLHRRVGPQVRLLAPADACRLAVELPSGNLELAALCPTHRVLLLLLNYCIFKPQHQAYEIPLRALYELAVICRNSHYSIDWTAIAEVVHYHSLEGPAHAWFNMAYRLLGAPVPHFLRADRTADEHLNACLWRLNLPRLAQPFGYLTRLTWAFNPLRMDYRYGCGLGGWPLAAARLHHAYVILSRRCKPPRRPRRTIVSQNLGLLSL